MATGWEQVNPALRDDAKRQEAMNNIRQTTTQVMQQPATRVLVAREGGQPAGYLVLTVVPDEWTREPTGLFYDIWIEPQWRGRGVSSLLTRTGENYLRTIGVGVVRRMIAAQNGPSLRHAQRDGCEVERLCLIKRL